MMLQLYSSLMITYSPEGKTSWNLEQDQLNQLKPTGNSGK